MTHPDYHRFLDLFNRGRFWDSHEALEAPWRDSGSEFYHALILYASAFVHVARGNRHGISAQLGKAQPLLERFRPAYLGLDVDRILEHASECRQIIAENPDAPAEAWPVLVPAPRLPFDPALVRGDEPEVEPQPPSQQP
jgi:predicted metal-dependent hydrolase